MTRLKFLGTSEIINISIIISETFNPVGRFVVMVRVAGSGDIIFGGAASSHLSSFNSTVTSTITASIHSSFSSNSVTSINSIPFINFKKSMISVDYV